MTYDPPHPQHQSAFVTFLPREIRDRVYLELWRSCGLRQHIVWHRDKDDKAKSHFCRWRCTTPFSVHDELQETIDATRLQLGFPLGDSFSNKAYALQLFSAWKNHFACGQRIARVYGEDADPGIRTCSSLGPCWSSHELSSEKLSTCSPYLSMLLSCKVLSSECLESIYESTTFIFTDIFALNMFIGFCKVPELWKEEVESQSSLCCCRARRLRYHHCQKSVTRLSISMGFALIFLENLMTLNIWVSARCTELLLDSNADNIDQSPYNITQLDLESLKEVLSPLNHARNVTLSMPLAQVSEPEDGYVVEDAHLRIWRRGVGDRYHPALSPIIEVERLSSNVYSSTKRAVKLAYNPQAEYHVHYSLLDTSAPGATEAPQSRGVARLVELIRAKGKRMKRDRKTQ
ncbi:hypothetical protein FOCG_05142 [Fusarium oxysporum f. sp. radicis-lycopersici 26381]|nr:hypothetical protein FOCG_05142 [Fusarium oxysporum f. sp. radicis-lycopersici 26381]